MNSNVLTGLKDLYNKYVKKNKKVLKSDIFYFEALKEISEGQDLSEAQELVSSLNAVFSDAALTEADEDEVEDSGVDAEDIDAVSSTPEYFNADSDANGNMPEELAGDETTFSEKYPEVDEENLLATVYADWITSVKGKPFYKVIRGFHEMYLSNTLNFLDRDFLWKFIKAISSCLTHILIEGEQKEEALCLVDKYYDSIIQCLNGVIHASDKEDVVTSFQYMVDFLGIQKEYAAPKKESEDTM